ncbi:MAG: hypothetical protein JRF08_08065 [Deltaproteobacteria bacterium]|nr:hypothetical protein [Deltaproteobacteria bacterium]
MHLKVILYKEFCVLGQGHTSQWVFILHCFVENYVLDIKLKKKFNSRLFGICLKNIFMGKYGGVTSVKDFYLKENNTAIDGVYFLLLLIKQVVKRLLRKREKDESA